MKVLFVTNHSFSHTSTSEHLMTAIIERLGEAGHHVVVLQMLNADESIMLPDVLTKYHVTTEGIRVKHHKKNHFAARYCHAVRNYLAYIPLFREHRDADAVFFQSTNVAGVAIWAACRYILNARITYNVQDLFPNNLAYSGIINKASVIYKSLAGIQRAGYRRAEQIITISEDMKESLINEGVPQEKISVIYNWSYQDEAYTQVDTTPVSQMFSKAYFNVVYAGNIGVMQNVDILVKAAGYMKRDNVWFHIIGNGVYKKKLEEQAKAEGIVNISFWPLQPAEYAPAIYSAADLNIIPLVKDVYKAALPSKTATCMACGQPILFAIGTDSIFGQQVQRETGCELIDTDDPEKIAQAIRRIQTSGMKVNTIPFFQEKMSKTKNSRAYAQIITGEKTRFTEPLPPLSLKERCD